MNSDKERRRFVAFRDEDRSFSRAVNRDRHLCPLTMGTGLSVAMCSDSRAAPLSTAMLGERFHRILCELISNIIWPAEKLRHGIRRTVEAFSLADSIQHLSGHASGQSSLFDCIKD